MIGALLLFGLIAALVMGYLILHHQNQSKYLAIAEYWVYLPTDSMPPQDEVMTRMIRDNPYARRGVSPIGTNEGLIFSDVRLHAALVLRQRNPHIFRPDQFAEHIKSTEDMMDALKASHSMVKLRFASEIPLKNKRHLQFLVHAADAYAAVGSGLVIFDVKAERLLSKTELAQILKDNFDATGCDVHTSVIWKPTIQGGSVETLGLTKIGLSELKTGEMNADQRVIATTVLEEASRKLWDLGTLPESFDVTTFDDTFKVQVEKVKDTMANVKILRVQAI